MTDSILDSSSVLIYDTRIQQIRERLRVLNISGVDWEDDSSVIERALERWLTLTEPAAAKSLSGEARLANIEKALARLSERVAALDSQNRQTPSQESPKTALRHKQAESAIRAIHQLRDSVEES